MPYTEKQIKLFRAAAHDPDIAKKHGMSMSKAREMSMEGVKKKKKKNLAEMAMNK